MAPWPDWLPIETVSLAAMVVTATLALYGIYRLDGRRRWGGTLRRRFVLGVPWGTVIVAGFVLAVYLFVQGAFGRLHEPVVVPFRSWSYRYPLGMVTAPFAHGDLGHLTGNLLSTVVFAPLVEYAWGHYPTERGSRSFGSLRTNPYARIAAFVVAVLLVGIATSFLVPGPLVGFSGVVFALAGYLIVARPVLAVFAVVGRTVVSLVYHSALRPVVTATAEPRFVEPWWADVAIQGHALGLLLGLVLGILVTARRRETPAARTVWFSAIVFAASEALYALYWQFGSNRFVMFRGIGLAVIFLLATMVVLGVATEEPPSVPRSELSLRHVSVGLLLAFALGIGIAAVPYNAVDIHGTDPDGVDVRDYTVTYDEDVPHGYVQAVHIPFVGDRLTGTVEASGVIVVSERRDAWREIVSAGQLGHDGRRSVVVGGLGWREELIANRSTWDAVDAGATYKVYLRRAGERPRLTYRADPVRLAPTVAGLNLSIEPMRTAYRLNVTRNGSVIARSPLPAVNESVDLAGIRFERRSEDLFAVHNRTRIRVASYQAGRRQGS